MALAESAAAELTTWGIVLLIVLLDLLGKVINLFLDHRGFRADNSEDVGLCIAIGFVLLVLIAHTDDLVIILRE